MGFHLSDIASAKILGRVIFTFLHITGILILVFVTCYLTVTQLWCIMLL
ncbi:hypothetical protein CPT_Phriendly_072 [Vibrio phage Phriendly]|nr:hypothetical protein CPT_Phriendly_072 [Vibrio phage Phriendly]